jgi:hypothetical protein
MRCIRRFVECYFGRGAGLNEKLAVDVAECAVTARVSVSTSTVLVIPARPPPLMRNLLACDSLLVLDEICARGQRFSHRLDSSRKCYDSIMMGGKKSRRYALVLRSLFFVKRKYGQSSLVREG